MSEKSGDGKTLLNKMMSASPVPTPTSATANGEAHGQHRAHRENQDDDCECQPDQLGLGWLELAEGRAADFDLNPVDLGREAEDLLTNLAGLGLVEVACEGDARECNPAGLVACGRDLFFVAGLIRASNRDALYGGCFGEHGLERPPDGWVCDRQVRAEHDVPLGSRANAVEVLIENIEAGISIAARNLESVVKGAADDPREREGCGEGCKPEPKHQPVMRKRPSTKTDEHFDLAGGGGSRRERGALELVTVEAAVRALAVI